MIKLTETITAISTAMSDSGIGIVRMSGPEAFEIADRIYKGKKQLSSQESHTVHYGWIKDGEDTIDEVLVILMRGPHSYTGEDTVEINCHGGVFVVRKILETVLKNGARAAEPGEFTKRAFLNGRMDLSRAEAVIDVIHSKNEFALKNSVSQLRGSIQRKIQAMRDEILYHTAYIESALDDPEHISLDGYAESLVEKTEKLLKELKKLINTADNGRKIQEGIRTVIVGKPNAGKSSLLNVLVGEDRAIVTDIEGTTRDILEEHIQLNGVSLNIVDTAGIRQTEEVVEKIGLPCFIKPSLGGSSFGVTKVKTKEQIQPAIVKAFGEAEEVIVEAFMDGTELTCGCYKTKEKSVIFPPTEVVTHNEFFDYDAKYNGQVDEITPARISDELTKRVQMLTSAIYDILGCSGIIRVDYIITAGEKLNLLEVNTTPGMTTTSFIPQQVRAAGLDIKDVMTDIIENKF